MPPSSTGDWLTIATFDNPMDAHLAKCNLAQVGIAAVLFDEQMGGLYGPTIGGVRLQVKVSDKVQAIQILRPHHLRMVCNNEKI